MLSNPIKKKISYTITYDTKEAKTDIENSFTLEDWFEPDEQFIDHVCMRFRESLESTLFAMQKAKEMLRGNDAE